MKLDLSSLGKAIKSLEFAMHAYDKNNDDLLRDACIQRFEYTYELSWKMLKRYLEMASPNPATIDEMNFQNLIRSGSEKALLLSGWDVWAIYRKARSTTSHVYNEDKAKEVFAVIPKFLVEAKYLLQKLQG